MNQRFDEDRAELEAHFAERIAAYIELGETPEQAEISAREKFGETEAVRRALRRRRVLHSPLIWALVSATGSLVMTYLSKHLLHQPVWISLMVPSFGYALYLLWGPKTKQVNKNGTCTLRALIQRRGR